MNAEKELKQKIKDIFGSSIKFNSDFFKHAKQLNNQEDNLIDWCNDIKEGVLIHYKPRKKIDSIVFIKKIGSSNRCVVLKQKNGIFTECHLGDHKYYDKLRKELGL